ncbi:MAG TPA: glutamine synthetase family protein [Actinomycetes bacterium]|jgi:glutamine synthetase|nr:glutamine synthetase family protein [Actinomycetes bacterium]
MELDEVLASIAADGIEFVRFEQTDLHGISRSKTIPARHVAAFARDGLNFLLGQLGFDAQAGVALGTPYLEARGFPDSRLFPDPDTYAPLPWADATARLLCTPHFLDGGPVPAAPRLVMQRLLDALADEGYLHKAGYEYELYLLGAADRQPPFPGIQIFATLRNSFDEAFVADVLRCMPAVGVDIITANAEYGPGQMEINFAPAVGIAAADQAFTFKNGVKEIARRHGLLASFMTKPYHDQSACGCHLHESLIDRETGRNVFAEDDTTPGRLSAVGRWWVGGQLAHLPALTAFFAPTVNCGKRFKDWSFAPVNATWGLENRSVAVRVKGLAGERLHVENRVPCGASNPYLVGAAAVAAGLDGIRNHIEPPAALDGVAYGIEGPVRLPVRLEAALDELEKDARLRELLGEELVATFLAVKRHEVAKATDRARDYDAGDWADRVDQFEIDELFEFL